MDLHAALRAHFGFAGSAPARRRRCAAAVAGHDVLVVMPTGAGKSLCYQLPALVRDDLTIVVSPLVSLMQDQVEALERGRPAAPRSINSQQDASTTRRCWRARARGALKLLYVAPERFSSPGFLRGDPRGRRSACSSSTRRTACRSGATTSGPTTSAWPTRRGWLGAKAIVASTATATPQVARDIVARLGLREPVAGRRRASTARTCRFAVVPCATTADKHARIAAALGEEGARPAIVYAGTRKACERWPSGWASSSGIEVLAYHAGLGRDERAAAQRRFMAGEVEVVVATNAFGMGVDKADVRTVAHEVVPPSIEAYYQEAGRAGRDGAPARALLFAEKRDKALHVFFIQRARGRRRGCSTGRRERLLAARSTAASTSAVALPATTRPSACARSSATSRGRA